MKVWGIIMFLFIFSAVSTVAEEYGGIGGVHVTNIGLDADNATSTTSTIYNLDDAGEPVLTKEDEFSLISGVGMILKAGVVFVKVILNTVFIYGILISYHVPAVMAAMIQGITTLIQSIGVVQFYSNRRIESR